MNFKEWLLVAEGTQAGKFAMHDLDPQQRDEMFRVFTDSYMQSTGKAWPRHTFDERTEFWEFYGTPPGQGQVGFVAVRPQMSGLIKLTGAAGSPLSVARGFKFMMEANAGKPIWGMMSDNFGPHLVKAGFINPPPELVLEIAQQIPQFAKQLQADGVDGGGVRVNVAGGLGTAVKHFYANPEYFRWVVNSPMSKVLRPDTLDRVAKLVGNRYQPGILSTLSHKAAGFAVNQAIRAKYGNTGLS